MQIWKKKNCINFWKEINANCYQSIFNSSLLLLVYPFPHFPSLSVWQISNTILILPFSVKSLLLCLQSNERWKITFTIIVWGSFPYFSSLKCFYFYNYFYRQVYFCMAMFKMSYPVKFPDSLACVFSITL